jgi:thermitase
MNMPGYEALGQWHDITLLPLAAVDNTPRRTMRGSRAVAPVAGPAAARSGNDARTIISTVENSAVLSTRISDPSNLRVVQGKVPVRRDAAGIRRPQPIPISTYDAVTLATETVTAQGLHPGDYEAAKKFGARVIEEGLGGRVLFAVDGVERAFDLAKLLLEREVGAVSPNFIRRSVNVPRSAAPQKAWSHKMIGVSKAWAVTQGATDVRVAVLDEGVDVTHPALKSAVYAQRDFIDENGDSAMPDNDDAHGTACAGIVLSRDKNYPGIAPKCSLIAARIAMGDGAGGWVFDDFNTGDAIRWSLSQGAAVLSNSWVTSGPSNDISLAFAEARTQGRGGLGSVVVIAAGNNEGPIGFPGDLPGYVTVGASNPDDERKTHSSSDGEYKWGSSYGPTMTLLAPGVFIWTTDISGPCGLGPGDFTKTFNGTSSATPAVAGAAALMISANPALSGASVRQLLIESAAKFTGQTDWTGELGWGRLDVGKAVKAAKRAGTGSP